MAYRKNRHSLCSPCGSASSTSLSCLPSTPSFVGQTGTRFACPAGLRLRLRCPVCHQLLRSLDKQALALLALRVCVFDSAVLFFKRFAWLIGKTGKKRKLGILWRFEAFAFCARIYARSTFPERKQRVQILIVFGVPSTTT